MDGLGRCRDNATRCSLPSPENDRATDRDWIKTAFFLIVLHLLTGRQRNERKYDNDMLKRTGIVFYDIQSRSRLSTQTVSSPIVCNLEITKSNKH